jgi:uncharacterized protein YutD
MSRAIKLNKASQTILQNVTIRGFDKGIEATDSDLLLSGVNVQRCGTGVELVRSNATFYNVQLRDNTVDLVINSSNAHIINTIAQRIVEITPKGDYRINPYRIEAIALQIINTTDIREKRKKLRQLWNVVKYTPLAWTAYQIIKEILRLHGINV